MNTIFTSAFLTISAFVGASPAAADPMVLDPHARAAITTRGGAFPVIGDGATRVTVFADWECPQCLSVVPDLLKAAAMKDAKFSVRLIDYPLDEACNPTIRRQVHRNACNLALWKRCAMKTMPLAQVLERIRQARSRLVTHGWRAVQSPTDSPEIERCMPTAFGDLTKDVKFGIAAGVASTPTIFVEDQQYLGPASPKNIGAAAEQWGDAHGYTHAP